MLKSNDEDDVGVALVLYPYIYDRTRRMNRPASLNISLDTNCMDTVDNLEKLAIDVFFDQSEDTASYEALELLEKGPATTRPTAVVTLTDGPSDVLNMDSPSSPNYPINRIRTAIQTIQAKQTGGLARFCAAGLDISVPAGQEALFADELLALGEGIPSHSKVTGADVSVYINTVLDLLVDANILCPNQSKPCFCISLRYNKYRLYHRVEVSTGFTPPRAAGPRQCKSRRDRTESCNRLVTWLLTFELYSH